MVDWVAGMADASVAERDSGFALVRVPGSPDVLKEAPVSGFVTKDAGDNVTLGGSTALLKFDVVGAVGVRKNASDSYASPGSFYMDPNGSSPSVAKIVFATDGTGYRLAFAKNVAGTVTNLWGLYDSGHFAPQADNAFSLGVASNRCSVIYAATGTINTSDESAKTDIGEIPDTWLDAWAGVKWRRFKMVNGKRWHVGLVAQQVHAAFAAHDLDAFEIGLCCFDAWDEEREPVLDEDGEPTGKTRVTLEAGDRWGLRYDECQAIEAAWQRRELARMAARLAALESAN